MSIDYNALAIPKGRTTKQLRAKAKREDAKQLKALRDAVWQRESLVPSGTVARCQDCDRLVYRRQGNYPFGHVHHVISRRHKATRTDVRNGRLLCQACHNKVHRREF